MTSGAVGAQVPENVVIVGTAAHAKFGGGSGTSGVFYVTLPTSKGGGGVITPLAPLPAALRMKVPGRGGAYSVLRRPSDGTLFVGDGAGPGGWCHVHILKVAGPVVLSSRSVQVGQAPRPGGPGGHRDVGGLALLPDGRVLVVAGAAFEAGPMQPSPIAILDDRPSTPTVTPILLTESLESKWAFGLALSPDGRTAYVTNPNINGRATRLYSIDLTKKGPVTPVKLHTWPKCFVAKLAVDRKGVLYTTCVDQFGAVAPSIEEIRVSNNKAVVKSIPVSPKTNVFGPALVRDSGKFVLLSTGRQVNANSVFLGDRSGTLSVLAKPPAGGWGTPVGIDINNTFETYGTGTKGANRYEFVDFPNPGGPAEVGNAKFSVTIESSPNAPTRSFLLIGDRPADRSFLGSRLLVELGRPYVLFEIAAVKSAVVALPIPNDSALRSTRLYAQSAHADAGAALATSNGLEIYIR